MLRPEQIDCKGTRLANGGQEFIASVQVCAGDCLPPNCDDFADNSVTIAKAAVWRAIYGEACLTAIKARHLLQYGRDREDVEVAINILSELSEKLANPFYSSPGKWAGDSAQIPSEDSPQESS
jgi:hypothetical protein